MATNGKKLKAGLLGLEGDSAAILAALVADPHFDLIGAAEVDPDAGEKLAELFQVRLFAGFEDLCANADIDVIIGTANRFRFQHAKRAIEAGKHVIFDKLIACSLDEANELIR